MDDLMKLTKLKLIEEIKSLENSIDRQRIEAGEFKKSWKEQEKKTRSCQADIKVLENKLSTIQQSIDTVVAMRYADEVANPNMSMTPPIIPKPKSEEVKLLLYLKREAEWYGHEENLVSDQVNTHKWTFNP